MLQCEEDDIKNYAEFLLRKIIAYIQQNNGGKIQKKFIHQHYNRKIYQNVAIVAHPVDVDYTRITEYTKLPYQDIAKRQ